MVSLLVDLPDPCLLAVLQLCAASGPRCLLSAARAHSRLHQAASTVISSVDATIKQQHMGSLALYLSKHGQHITSIGLAGDPPHCGLSGVPAVPPLPTSLRQLDSLSLTELAVQLPLDQGYQRGVLHAGAPIRSLRLQFCQLEPSLMAPALAALPHLRHLSIINCKMPHCQTVLEQSEESDATDSSEERDTTFYVVLYIPGAALQALPQQLTHLELDGVAVDDPQTSMQHLAQVTCLQELQLQLESRWTLTADMAFNLQSLTRLQLMSFDDFDFPVAVEAGMLACVSKLQHLCWVDCGIVGGAVGVAALLSELQPMTQLTYLSLNGSLWHFEDGPPAAAYAALTASSRLQHLNLSECSLPAGALQQMLPETRQLTRLTELDISHREVPITEHMELGDITRLVSCCPALQSVSTYGKLTAELLAPLGSLTGLQDFAVSLADDAEVAGASMLAQMTGLQQLHLFSPTPDAVLLQLTRLHQLSELYWPGRSEERFQGLYRPGCVWPQVLRGLVKSSSPDVAQQAAAALAELQQLAGAL